MAKNDRRIAKNAIYMYIRMLVMMLVSLYTTRVVLSTLGIEDYGIYTVVGGIVVFFSFINSGLAGATKRYILAELAVGDLLSQKKIYSLAINVHLLIVTIIIVVGETVGLWILYNIINIPEGRMEAAVMVYQASLITAVFGILQSPFTSVIISFERMAIYAYLSILDVLLKLGIVFFVQIIDGDKLIWYAYLLIFISFINIVAYYVYCRKKFEMCQYVKSNDKDTFISILRYIGWTVFGSGANVLSKQGVSILVNNFFTVAVNASMGISNTIVSAASQFVSNLQVVFAPQLTKNYISKDNLSLIHLLFQSSRYTSFLILIILVPITFVISDLLVVWLGEYPEYTEEFCLLTLVCVYIESVSMPLTTIITAEKNIRKYQVIISSLYIVNVFLCWGVLLIGVLPFVVIIVRAVVDLFMVAVRLWLTKKKVVEFSIMKWCKEVYGKALFILGLSAPLIIIIDYLEMENVIVRLFVIGGACLLWMVSLIWCVGLTRNEKAFIFNKIPKNFKK